MIIVGTDTYVTVVEADVYFSVRTGFESWALLDEPSKEKALVSATQQLDLLCGWYGTPVVDSQALAFPRDPDANPVPQAVKNAQCEIAFNVSVTGSTSTEGGRNLKSLEADGNLEWFERDKKTNPLVNDLTSKLLAPYGLCSGTGSTKIIPVVLA